MDPLKYSIVIEWSNEDNKYIVTLPEFPNCHTHGASYDEALQNGKEVLEMVIDKYQALRQPLPQPNQYAA